MGALHHLGAQGGAELGLAIDEALVEKNAGEHERLGLGELDPAVKILAPLLQRLAPLVGHGHHLAGAMHVAAVG